MTTLIEELRRKANAEGCSLVFRDLFARAASRIEDLEKELEQLRKKEGSQ